MLRITIIEQEDGTWLVEDGTDLCDPVTADSEAGAYHEAEAMADDVEEDGGVRPEIVKL